MVCLNCETVKRAIDKRWLIVEFLSKRVRTYAMCTGVGELGVWMIMARFEKSTLGVCSKWVETRMRKEMSAMNLERH